MIVRTMGTRFQPFCLLLLVTGPAWAVSPSATELRDHCRQVLQHQLEQPVGEIGRHLAELDPLVMLSPDQIVWQGDAPVWRCLAMRKLLAHEQQRVWECLEEHQIRMGSEWGQAVVSH